MDISKININEILNKIEENNKNTIEICVQDFNGDVFLFYDNINLETYEIDINRINEKIKKLNVKDQDIRGQYTKYNNDLEGLYKFFVDSENINELLNNEWFELASEKIELGHYYFFELLKEEGITDIKKAKSFSYRTYDSYEDLFEELFEETHHKLHEIQATHLFDYERFFEEYETGSNTRTYVYDGIVIEIDLI